LIEKASRIKEEETIEAAWKSAFAN